MCCKSHRGGPINGPSRQCLDPYVQRFVAKVWSQSRPIDEYPTGILEQFDDVEWIIENSGGEYKPSPVLKALFANIPDKQLQSETALPEETLQSIKIAGFGQR